MRRDVPWRSLWGDSVRNRLAMYLAIIAGLLLMGAGITGAATWQTIRDFVVSFLGDHWALILLFQVLIFIASLGGIIVMCGGVLVGLGTTSIGKLLIALGTGAGLLGLIIAIALPTIGGGGVVLATGTASGAIGIVLSIAARIMAK